jgi:hypothetical protein
MGFLAKYSRKNEIPEGIKAYEPGLIFFKSPAFSISLNRNDKKMIELLSSLDMFKNLRAFLKLKHVVASRLAFFSRKAMYLIVERGVAAFIHEP